MKLSTPLVIYSILMTAAALPQTRPVQAPLSTITNANDPSLHLVKRGEFLDSMADFVFGPQGGRERKANRKIAPTARDDAPPGGRRISSVQRNGRITVVYPENALDADNPWAEQGWLGGYSVPSDDRKMVQESGIPATRKNKDGDLVALYPSGAVEVDLNEWNDWRESMGMRPYLEEDLMDEDNELGVLGRRYKGKGGKPGPYRSPYKDEATSPQESMLEGGAAAVMQDHGLVPYYIDHNEKLKPLPNDAKLDVARGDAYIDGQKRKIFYDRPDPYALPAVDEEKVLADKAAALHPGYTTPVGSYWDDAKEVHPSGKEISDALKESRRKEKEAKFLKTPKGKQQAERTRREKEKQRQDEESRKRKQAQREAKITKKNRKAQNAVSERDSRVKNGGKDRSPPPSIMEEQRQ